MDSEKIEKQNTANKRDVWNKKIDFIFTITGYTIGLGNVWRFPYLCYVHGGGAFLIPYIIYLAIGAIPIYFLEISLGQFMTAGGLQTWNICPLMKGVPVASMTVLLFGVTYYNVIMAWAVYYLYASFSFVLPWSTCDNSWNTDKCTVKVKSHTLKLANDTMNGTDLYSFNLTSYYNDSGVGEEYLFQTYNKSETLSITDPSTEFWENKVLGISDGIDNMGTVRWELMLCLLFTTIVAFCCIWRGIKTSGKVMYFTATFPYVIMTILLIRGITLPGSLEGIKVYLFPDLSKLKTLKVWIDAATQIFYSYSIGFGTLTVLGSFNHFNYNCYRDVFIVSAMNSGTSFFVGFVVFAVLGFMAHEQGLSVHDVAESGPGLAFVAYPNAVAQMPLAPFWSVLFFLMILLIGVGTLFVAVESIATVITDEFPFLRAQLRKKILVGSLCVLIFILGIPMITNGGMYLFQLWDYYACGLMIMLVGFIECISISYIYGGNRYFKNMELMLGYKISPYMRICWLYTAPAYLFVIFVLCMVNHEELVYNRTYVYPRWAIMVGWLLAMVSILMIPLVMIVQISQTPGSFLEVCKQFIYNTL